MRFRPPRRHALCLDDLPRSGERKKTAHGRARKTKAFNGFGLCHLYLGFDWLAEGRGGLSSIVDEFSLCDAGPTRRHVRRCRIGGDDDLLRYCDAGVALPLFQGGRVVIASREQAADATELIVLLREQEISLMQATPTTWRLLLAAGWTGSSDLKVLMWR